MRQRPLMRCSICELGENAMATISIPRVVIAGTNSGVGKTTLVTGLLAAFKKRGLKVQSYKVGPDYIDPGYHYLASGQRAHNLDSWLMPLDKLSELFVNTAAGNDLVIIEGVMGLYDGGKNGISSTAVIAKLLDAPVLLVVDAKAMGESVAALALGYKVYDPEVRVAGVIANRLGSASHAQIVTTALEKQQFPVLGRVLRNETLKMPERHLGLTPVEEQEDFALIERIAEQIERDVDMEQVLRIARQTSPRSCPESPLSFVASRIKIGVAKDEAFSFYYPESLAVLEQLGAELIPFSPLKDRALPEVDGLIFGGGFPEMFAARLEANLAMRQAIRRAAGVNMPVYAECGGLMYLTQSLVDFSGKEYQMAGVIPAKCTMQHKLQTVGYVQAKALNDNLLCARGAGLRGHEFHFSQMTPLVAEEEFPWAFTFTKNRTGTAHHGGYAQGNVLASYLHLHFAGCPEAAVRFVEKCTAFKAQNGKW